MLCVCDKHVGKSEPKRGGKKKNEEKKHREIREERGRGGGESLNVPSFVWLCYLHRDATTCLNRVREVDSFTASSRGQWTTKGDKRSEPWQRFDDHYQPCCRTTSHETWAAPASCVGLGEEKVKKKKKVGGEGS